MMRASSPDKLDRFQLAARLAAVLYVAWGLFHVRAAWDIYGLGEPESGLVQGRLFQLAAYMLTIALFVVGVALLLNWKNNRAGYWLNLCVAGWADLIWVAAVVAPRLCRIGTWPGTAHRLRHCSHFLDDRPKGTGLRVGTALKLPCAGGEARVSEHETFSADNANIEAEI